MPADALPRQRRARREDNADYILDCAIGPLDDPAGLERDILAIPGVVDTGMFLDMADTVLIGDRADFKLLEERKRRLTSHLRLSGAPRLAKPQAASPPK